MMGEFATKKFWDMTGVFVITTSNAFQHPMAILLENPEL